MENITLQQTAFLICMALAAFLGSRSGASGDAPLLWTFVGILAYNFAVLTARIAFRVKPAIHFAINLAFVTMIVQFSGGSHSSFWPLYLLPIFDACLSFGRRGARWGLAAVLLCAALPHARKALRAADWGAVELLIEEATLSVSGFVTLTVSLQERKARRQLEEQQRKFEEERRALAERLIRTDRLATLGTLVGSLTQELNNPLAALLGACELIRTNPKSPLNGLEDMQIIEASAQRCKNVVEHLGSFARIKSDPPEKGDINELVGECIRIKRADSLSVRLVADLEPDLPEAWVSASEVQQPLFNLLSNAYEAILSTRAGGRVVVRTRRSGAFVHIDVEDNGPGIPAQDLPRLFDPFFTTKPGRLGVGLTIARRLVEGRGGLIAPRASAEKGAAFRIQFPIFPDATVPDIGSLSVAGRTLPAPTRLLVADHEHAVAHMVARALSGSRLSIDTTGSFDATLAELERDLPAVLIIDLQMPGMEATEFLRRIESKGWLTSMKVIVVTASSQGEWAEDWIQRNAAAMLKKPFRLQMLKKAVNFALASINTDGLEAPPKVS